MVSARALRRPGCPPTRQILHVIPRGQLPLRHVDDVADVDGLLWRRPRRLKIVGSAGVGGEDPWGQFSGAGRAELTRGYGRDLGNVERVLRRRGRGEKEFLAQLRVLSRVEQARPDLLVPSRG